MSPHPQIALVLASLAFIAAPANAQGGTAVPTPVQLPVVLDVQGIGGTHFTSDLTVVHVGHGSSPVELTFVPAATAPARLAPVLSEWEMEPGTTLYVPDVIDYLRQRGANLPAGSAQIGTLFVRLPLSDDDTPPFVGSRISTPNPSATVGGSFGTYATGDPVGTGSTFRTALYGLRETAAFRTNLGIAHAGGGPGAPIQLRLDFVDGKTGLPAGDPLRVTLQPGEFRQLNSVLNGPGIEQGWVRISQEAGGDRFIAYAVVNDGASSGGGTGDGSIIEAGAKEGFLPIVLAGGRYQTELVLTNDSTEDAVANLYYVSADALGAESFHGLAVRFTMPPRTQVIEPDAIALLRRMGIAIPDTGVQGGTLRVTGVAALARVWTANPDPAVGGTFGLAFPAFPPEKRATAEAWVFGLRQDSTVRSNIAIANARVVGDPSTFEVTIYDARNAIPKMRYTRTLQPGQWYQWNAVLADAGIPAGYADVRCTSAGGGDFVTYGVLNDGAAPGQGTSDGSFVAMAGVK